jgi:hypothetical protein
LTIPFLMSFRETKNLSFCSILLMWLRSFFKLAERWKKLTGVFILHFAPVLMGFLPHKASSRNILFERRLFSLCTHSNTYLLNSRQRNIFGIWLEYQRDKNSTINPLFYI